jgi:thiol:disulfide interchange protein DsbC
MMSTILSLARSLALPAIAAVALAGAVPSAIAATAAANAAPGAADAAAPPPPEAAAIKKALLSKFPGVNIGVINKSPYFGLFEVMFDDRIVYTDARAKYVVIGSIYDTDAKVNLTEQRMRKLNRVDVATLPLDMAIKRVRGNGQRTLYLFSDADCPYCAKFEQELKGIDNVTIYTFLFPIDTLHPDAARKSRIIWCSADREQSWEEFFKSGALPENAGDCENPVVQTHALGEKLRVTATPTLVFADGSIVPGAIPTAQLETELTNAGATTDKAGKAAK